MYELYKERRNSKLCGIRKFKFLKYPANQNWILNAESVKAFAGILVGTEAQYGFAEVRD
jgi:hypothetical protein